VGRLINIDNGGTLTDICVIDGASVLHTKVLTTPYDLSKCFAEGLRKAAWQIYGDESRLDDLLLDTDHIRYSTTQGTNAVVERKGPRLGLVLAPTGDCGALRAVQEDLFKELVGERVVRLDHALRGPAYEAALTAALTSLSATGANRIVVCFDGPDYRAAEIRLKEIALRRFPRHLLGVVPLLCAGDLVEDADFPRRAWSALLNAFLHPVMESFLYNAEDILREAYHRHPLLIFRNDGDSARVARTVAIKTYSSGPRGGMEGARALALHYGHPRLLSMDIGGTTTDIGLVEGGEIRAHKRGVVGGAVVSLPLCDVVSVGIGGSSYLGVASERVLIGPESAGAAPGPACFGLGGRRATITDVFLLSGLLDPDTYFGGSMKLDRDRARAAVETDLAQALRLDLADALKAAERAWIREVAEALRRYDTGSASGRIAPDTTLAAFGGAGPFVITAIADAAGIDRVVIPALAAVFSAFGIGFSDIAQRYEAPLNADDATAIVAELRRRARRDMFAEGYTLEECRQEWQCVTLRGEEESSAPWHPDSALPRAPAGSATVLRLRVVRPLAHPGFAADAADASPPGKAAGMRHVLTSNAGLLDLPVHRLEHQPAGATGEGPCILEEAYFTGRIDAGWRYRVSASRDVILTRSA